MEKVIDRANFQNINGIAARIVKGRSAVAREPSFVPDFFNAYHERFIEEPMSGCWLWLGSRTSAGYGNLTYQNKSYYAHRCSFEAESGPGSSVGFQVRHRCDNPCCMNPSHLLLGSPVDNAADAKARDRLNTVRGEKSGRSVLTEVLVAEMRAMAANGSFMCDIARKYGVARTTIEAAITGQTWAQLPGAVPLVDIPNKPVEHSPRKGEEATNSILKTADVLDIRKRLALGESGRKLAAEFRVSPVTISAIKVRRIWQHV